MDERDGARRARDDGWLRGVAFLAGVVLPLAAVAIELEGAWLGSIVASPIPTGGHVALLLLVIASNVLGLIATHSLATRRVMPILNGIAIGVSGVYTVMFLPLMPLSLIGIVFYGIGLLGFAPLATFLVALWARRRLKRLNREAMLVARPEPPESYRHHPEAEPVLAPRLRGTLVGIVTGLGMLLLLEMSPALTHYVIGRAASSEPAVAARAIRQLRVIGDDDVLVAACHGRRHQSALSLLVGGSPPPPLRAREIYYRVHGERCPPLEGWGRGAAFFRGGNVDEDQGSDRVGGLSETLTLVSSRIDGSIDGEAALGYTEWTLTFRNEHEFREAEARALLALPPGGVISRATLWIDGEEREAAFGGRGTVQRAYRRVVEQRRDPLLVTSAGPDRALVQCFPIAPKGGEMKVRVGITFPLSVVDDTRAVVIVPRLLARNFNVTGEPDARALWLESDEPLVVDEVPVAADADGVRRFRRAGLDPDAPVQLISIRQTRDASAFALDPFDRAADAEERARVWQRVVPRAVAPPSRLVVGVDTSAGMAPHRAEIIDALAALPDGLEAVLVVGGDGPGDIHVLEPEPMGGALRDRWASVLSDVEWEGGRDNVPLLGRAWDLAAERDGAVVLWIHAAQPVAFAPAEVVLHRWERRPDGPKVMHLQVGQGEDTTLSALFGQASLDAVERRGSPRDDLARQLERWADGAQIFERQIHRDPDPRTRQASDRPAGAASARTSPHLTRLWALEESDALAARGEPEQAVELAVRYQLVTPVSGAVVLESASQYDEAGLQPVDSETVPTVPEPETWALLIVMAGALVLFARSRRRYGLA